MKPLRLVTVVFNPRRFASRVNLYRRFAKWVADAGVKMVTVEVAFGERPFEVTDASDPWHLRLRTRHELWFKERALNLAIHRLGELDPDWGYVGWMDCDVKLVRDDWAVEAVQLLQHYAVIQMFGEARSLGPNHQALENCSAMTSIMSNFERHGRIDWFDNPGLKAISTGRYGLMGQPRAGHPGLAWAFRRRELASVGGLLDVCVNGSGDLHMAGCFTGDPDLAVPEAVSQGYKAAIRLYGRRCAAVFRRNASFMPGACDHYWHGRSRERGYDDRWRLLSRHQFDPATDLIVDDSGLYAWDLSIPRVMDLAVETRKSLAARNEDANEV